MAGDDARYPFSDFVRWDAHGRTYADARIGDARMSHWITSNWIDPAPYRFFALPCALIAIDRGGCDLSAIAPEHNLQFAQVVFLPASSEAGHLTSPVGTGVSTGTTVNVRHPAALASARSCSLSHEAINKSLPSSKPGLRHWWV